MREATLVAGGEKKVSMSDLCDRIEDVLRDGDREEAEALLPELRVLCKKLARLRRFSAELAGVGLSKYVMGIAALAGRAEEFAEFA